MNNLMQRLAWLLLTSIMMIGDGATQTAKIVGTGATRCATFLNDVAGTPVYEREYFSWAQGYMSGILFRAPPDKDQYLDLTPPEFPVKTQLEFFRNYCATHPQEGYADAVETLYKRLRDFSPK